MACASPSTYAPSRNAHADMKWLSKNPVETAVYFSGSGKKRKMGLKNTPACFGSAGRLLSRRRQKASGQQQVPNDIVKTSKLPRENRANGHGTGTGRKYANLTRPRTCRMKAGCRFLRHFAVRHGTPCGRNPPPRQPREGNGLQKDKRALHADGLHPGRKKPSEALFFPPPCTRRNCLAAKKLRLCGRRFISLRKAILFLPRKNALRDGEMLHTNSFSTCFLTVRPLFAAVRPVIGTRKRNENLAF